MTEQTHLKWTVGLIALSLPFVLAIGVGLLMIIGSSRTMI